MAYTALSLMGTPGMAHTFVVPVVIDEWEAQLENDLDTFFNPDDFAQEIIYTGMGQTGVSIDAIVIRDKRFYEPYVRGLGIGTLKLYVKSTDMPNPQYGDAFEIDGETWVYHPQNDLMYVDNHVLHLSLERELVKTKVFAKSMILLETGDKVLLETGDFMLKD